jgi:hypothetical protein
MESQPCNQRMMKRLFTGIGGLRIGDRNRRLRGCSESPSLGRRAHERYVHVRSVEVSGAVPIFGGRRLHDEGRLGAVKGSASAETNLSSAFPQKFSIIHMLAVIFQS